MPSDVESDVSDSEARQDKNMEFALLLKSYPVLLSKSQVPAIKDKKEKASTEFLLQLLQKQGVSYTKSKLAKKISRIKGDVKKKTDASRTGNKIVHLKPWEKILFEMMGADANPSVGKLEGAVSIGIKNLARLPTTTDDDSTLSLKTSDHLQEPPRLSPHHPQEY